MYMPYRTTVTIVESISYFSQTQFDIEKVFSDAIEALRWVGDDATNNDLGINLKATLEGWEGTDNDNVVWYRITTHSIR